MYKFTTTYEDFNGDERTETFYFNISKAETAKLQMNEVILNDDGTVIDGIQNRLTAIAKSGNGKKIMEAFEFFIQKSYGVKSDDGKRFVKSDDLWKEFQETPAYDNLFMKLVTEAEFGAEFIEGIFPKAPEDHKSKTA